MRLLESSRAGLSSLQLPQGSTGGFKRCDRAGTAERQERALGDAWPGVTRTVVLPSSPRFGNKLAAPPLPVGTLWSPLGRCSVLACDRTWKSAGEKSPAGPCEELNALGEHRECPKAALPELPGLYHAGGVVLPRADPLPTLGMAEAGASVLLLRTCLALLAFPVYLLSFLGLWEPFCRKVFFPFILEKISTIHDKKSKKHKLELFRNLADFRSPSGELRLLEIGTGAGGNFQFYPPGCKVTCTDINPNFQESLTKNMKKNQHLHYERFLVAAGEDLHQVPSGSVDVVVCTLVLCSVQSVSSTLREVLRVLRPGGAFYFLEHVAAEHSSWKYFWQQVCFPTWKLVFAGCCLTRELWKNLEEAKFSELKVQHISLALPWTPIQPHIVGYGVK